MEPTSIILDKLQGQLRAAILKDERQITNQRQEIDKKNLEIEQLKQENRQLKESLEIAKKGLLTEKEKANNHKSLYNISNKSMETTLKVAISYNNAQLYEHYTQHFRADLNEVGPFLRAIRVCLRLQVPSYCEFLTDYLIKEQSDQYLISDTSPDSKLVYSQLRRILNFVLREDTDFIEDKHFLYLIMFKLLYKFGNTVLKTKILHLLKPNQEQLMNLVMEKDNPELYLLWLNILQQHKLTSWINTILDHVWKNLLVIYSKGNEEQNFRIFQFLHQYKLDVLKKTFPTIFDKPDSNAVSITGPTSTDSTVGFDHFNSESRLLNHGYRVSKTSDHRRWQAILSASKEMPIADIESFIEWRLRLAIANHSKGDKNYSRSIHAYETDLVKIRQYFHQVNM